MHKTITKGMQEFQFVSEIRFFQLIRFSDFAVSMTESSQRKKKIQPETKQVKPKLEKKNVFRYTDRPIIVANSAPILALFF